MTSGEFEQPLPATRRRVVPHTRSRAADITGLVHRSGITSTCCDWGEASICACVCATKRDHERERSARSFFEAG